MFIAAVSLTQALTLGTFMRDTSDFFCDGKAGYINVPQVLPDRQKVNLQNLSEARDLPEPQIPQSRRIPRDEPNEMDGYGWVQNV